MKDRIDFNLQMQELEVQGWLDRENEKLKHVKASDGMGYLFIKNRQEDASLKLKQVRERRRIRGGS